MSVLLVNGIEHDVTYKLTKLMDFSVTLAELPANDMKFTSALNGAGSWAGTLNVEDSSVRRSNWLEAIDPWRSALWIDIDGTLVFGGPVVSNPYKESTGIVSLSGIDFYGYLAHRRQAQDYKEYTDPHGHAWWREGSGAPVTDIVYFILKQAMEVPSSPAIEIVAAEASTPEEFWITYSAPRSQNQTLETMLSQLHQLGYGVGVDVRQEVRYVAGVPTVSLGIFYPRAGLPVSQTGLVIESRLDLNYQKDGSQESNGVVEMVGGTSAVSEEKFWPPAYENEEYPLLEQIVSHPSVSPTTQSQRVLTAYAEGDLALYTYPLSTPVPHLDMFGAPSIFDLLELGNDAKLRIPQQAGQGPNTCPRFPDGLDFDFRTVRLEGNIPNEGVSTMDLTLNVPPSSTPIIPPL